MNLQTIKQRLDKINRLYAYLEDNQDIISIVDRDALLASIRELYDACFDEDIATTTTTTKRPVVEEPVVAPKEEKTVEVAETPKKKRPKLVFNTNSTPKQERPTKEEAVVSQKETEIPKAEIKEEKTPEPVVEPTPVVAAQPTTPKVETAPTAPTTQGFNEEYEELFLFKAATDLSQKLSAAPLKDLNKALGLNEKFLYINELFGGDVAKFQAAIKTLNNGESFDTARSYIEINLIEQHEWMNKPKKPVAKDFVKLIRRRYL